MKQIINRIKKSFLELKKLHFIDLSYLVLLGYFLVSYLKYGFMGMDFGYTHDEHRILGSIIESAKSQLFLPGWYNYPSLTYFISLVGSFVNVAVNVIAEVGVPTSAADMEEFKLVLFKFAKENHINVHFFLRKTFFLISFIGSLSLYFSARQFGVRKRYAALASLLALCSFQLFYHSRWIAPDQLLYTANAFSILAFLTYFKSKRYTHLIYATILCAVVLSAKYQGGLLLVALLYIAFKERLSIKKSIGVLLVYVLTFMVITPGCFVEPVKFISDVLFEVQHYSTQGFGLHKVETGFWHLLRLLDYIIVSCCASHPILSVLVFLLASVGSYFVFKENKNTFFLLVIIPVGYVLYFSTQMLMIVRNYLFVLPFIFLLSSIGIDRLAKKVHSKMLGLFSLAFLLVSVIYSSNYYQKSSLSVHSDSSEWIEKVNAFISDNDHLRIGVSKEALKYVSTQNFNITEDTGVELDYLVFDMVEYLDFNRKYVSNDSIKNTHLLGQKGIYKVIAGPDEMDINCYPNWPGKSRIMALEGPAANIAWFYFHSDSALVISK